MAQPMPEGPGGPAQGGSMPQGSQSPEGAGAPMPQQGPGGGIPIPMPMPAGLQPGQQPSPEQIRQMQMHIAAEAQKAGLSVPEYVERMKAQAMQQHQMRQQMMAQQRAMAQQQQQMAQQPAQPGPPKPEAIALAKFLQSQPLKPRTCILHEKRRDMFRVKRAIRAINSEAYRKFRAKNPTLPEVTDRASAENCFKLLPMSLLALRVSKIDPDQGHEGHSHGKKKRVKGLWTVKVEQQQEAHDDLHYVWLYEGAQWKNKLYAAGALFVILALVFFPVWPYHLRLGVWWLSMACLGFVGLFFALAIVRLILFLVTIYTHPPGLWIYPNLFEDVGFFDSFKPAYAWHEDEKAVMRRKKAERERKRTKREAKEQAKAAAKAAKTNAIPQASMSVDNATATGVLNAKDNVVERRNMMARVEEVADDE